MKLLIFIEKIYCAIYWDTYILSKQKREREIYFSIKIIIIESSITYMH